MLTPEAVGNMCHAELSAWIDSVLESMGVQPEKEIISLRQRPQKNEVAKAGTKDSTSNSQ
ncbi:hypothetical protein [Snodgrassella communis]|jgi:hypothetical protein|uniref:hypothetical protein n=1 Tax=Snodgrassella communis TaxID=2946699 RepID=UPI000461D62F|nr:hypothetical protein [Snodgrassella communis]KDN12560.1 hypothetical protein SALWKB12_1084 [Snodgrassella communis]